MTEIRPRLQGDPDLWEKIISLARERGLSETISAIMGNKDANREFEQDISGGKAREVFTVDNPPTTLEEALKNSKADLSIWQVQKWLWNHWAGNYQVKVWFERKTIDNNDFLNDHLVSLEASFKKVKAKKVPGSKVGVIMLADFHFGMDYQGDAKNPAFSIDILTEKVRQVADKINAQGFKEVHLALIGDFIESFTGLNHMDTWKHLSSYGVTAVRGICELLAKELIAKVNNLKEIYIVSGNHDRISVKKDIDGSGEAAKLIADFLSLMVEVPVNFDYVLLNPVIDGIKYIFSHGHLGLSKRDEYATILEYGDQNIYNVIAQGHLHKREVKKGRKVIRNTVSNVVSLEGSNFRKIIVPPLVTGGAFSSSLGLFGTAGATVISNNGFGGVDHLDLSV